jgi:preprotein translocase subunit YajC
LIAGVLVFVLMVALTVYLVTRGEEKENKKKEQS